MSLSQRKPRVVSGVLFSPPADWENLEPDVRPGKNGSLENCHGNHYPATQSPNGIAYVNSVNVARSAFHTYPDRPRNRLMKEAQLETPKSSRCLCLPILSVSIDVTIDGIVASAEVQQKFKNPSHFIIEEAEHVFPLYNGSVVTSFECLIGNHRSLRGVVKPKSTARKQYHEATRERNEVAALLEEADPEIFKTSLGNIPAQSTVEVRLKYVYLLKPTQLLHGAAEGLLLSVPTSIAPLYGSPLFIGRNPELPENQLEICIRVIDDGKVDTQGCQVESRHAVMTTFEGLKPAAKPLQGTLDDIQGMKTRQEAVWRYTSNESAILKTDFVLALQMRPDFPLRSSAVRTPVDSSGHAAILVNVRPNDLFGNAVKPEAFTGELLFILDRSGSMGWTKEGDNELKIDALRSAMRLVLSGLPETCHFNILSFGSEVRGMWPESRKANDPRNIHDAKRYTDGVEADMGGTEILLALKAAVDHRVERLECTRVLLVTDGEVKDDNILKYIWDTRRELGEKVRFFSLGLGDRVSHRTLEKIADLGGGYCDIVDVVKKPRWEGRLNRMLKSTLEPNSWSFEISLGEDFEKHNLGDFSFQSGYETGNSKIPFIQAPFSVPPLHPYTFKPILFLLNLKDKTPPANVIIRTTTEGARNDQFELSVQETHLRVIQHLAAKAAFLDLDCGLPGSNSDCTFAKENGEYLGSLYSITNKWAAFVALNNNDPEQVTSQIDITRGQNREDYDLEHYLRVYGDSNYDSSPSRGPFPHRRTQMGISAMMGVDDTLHQGARPAKKVRAMKLMDSVSPFNACESSSIAQLRVAPIQVPEPMTASDFIFDEQSISDSRILPDHSHQSYTSDGSLTWKVAVARQKNNIFVLSDVEQTKVRSHFCQDTAQALDGKLLARVKPEDVQPGTWNGVVDTLMLNAYFRTHLLVEEDTWTLLVGKAERAVLGLLGINQETRGWLDEFYEMLGLSAAHVHFRQAVHKASASLSTSGRSTPSPKVASTCPVCSQEFGLLGDEIGGFYCLSDECYVADRGTRRRKLDDWASFWEHQIRSGHVLCPADYETS